MEGSPLGEHALKGIAERVALYSCKVKSQQPNSPTPSETGLRHGASSRPASFTVHDDVSQRRQQSFTSASSEVFGSPGLQRRTFMPEAIPEGSMEVVLEGSPGDVEAPASAVLWTPVRPPEREGEGSKSTANVTSNAGADAASVTADTSASALVNSFAAFSGHLVVSPPATPPALGDGAASTPGADYGACASDTHEDEVVLAGFPDDHQVGSLGGHAYLNERVTMAIDLGAREGSAPLTGGATARPDRDIRVEGGVEEVRRSAALDEVTEQVP